MESQIIIVLLCIKKRIKYLLNSTILTVDISIKMLLHNHNDDFSYYCIKKQQQCLMMSPSYHPKVSGLTFTTFSDIDLLKKMDTTEQVNKYTNHNLFACVFITNNFNKLYH